MQFLEKLWKMCANIDIKLVRTERRENYLVTEPNYHTTVFQKTFMSNRHEKKNKDTYE